MEGFGRQLITLELMEPRSPSPHPAAGTAVHEDTGHFGHDPHSTTAAHIEQAAEPPPAFGFGTGTLLCRCGRSR